MNYHEAYITTVKYIGEYHRSHIILHKNYNWYLAEFENEKQLEYWAKLMGFTYQLETQQDHFAGAPNVYREYSLSHKFNDNHGYFWNVCEIPEGAKKFWGHSNGCLVTCYFVNDGETIHIYRPNPNAKEVYNPMSLAEELKWKREMGGF